MNKKILAVAFALVMVVVLSGTVAAADSGNSTNTITQAADGAGNSSAGEAQATSSNIALPDPQNTRTGISYTTIQAAIDSVFTLNGDTITVEAGTYNEDVLVWKSLHLVGADPATTFVNSFYINTAGSGSEITGFTVTGGTGEAITLQDADNCAIHGNNISGGYSAGVALVNSDNNNIYSNVIDNSVSANYYGIYLDNSTLNDIYGNTITDSLFDGIWLLNSDNNTIGVNDGNSIADNTRDGIRIESSDSNQIENNLISGNLVDGIFMTDADSNTLTLNTITGSPVGIELIFSNDNILGIQGSDLFNTIAGPGATVLDTVGISITESSGNIINSAIGTNGINADGFEIGILLDNATSTILNVVSVWNCGTGIRIENESSATLTAPWVKNNGLNGIDVTDSTIIIDTGIGGSEITGNDADGILAEDSLVDIQNTLIDNNGVWGIHLINCDAANLFKETISNNGLDGIYIEDSDDVQIIDSTITDNGGSGIYLDTCSDCLIDPNTITGNTEDGIFATDCDGLEIEESTISNNGDGVFLTNSPETAIKDNQIFNNDDDGIDIDNSDNVIVFQNNIHGNDYGVNIRGTSDDVNVNFNRIANNNVKGLLASSTGDVDAVLNWWGYNGAADVANQISDSGLGDLDYSPWIVLSITASPTIVGIGGQSTITADLLHDSNGVFHNPANGVVPYDGPAGFATTLGTITDVNFSNGSATSTLTNLNTSGTADVSSTVDSQTVHTFVTVNPAATIAQIISASATVKAYYELNHVLPSTVAVGATNVDMPQFLYLLVTATRNINVGNLNSINIIPVNPAPAPSGTYTPGSLVKSSYLSVALNIQNFIIANGRAPNFAQTSLGKIPFSKLVYMYAKVINFYGLQARLPNYVIS